MVKIVFICHGNICRSPMAEFVLKDMVKKRGISDDFFIMDTPGILWPKFEDQVVGLKLAMCGSIKDEILDLENIVMESVDYLAKNYPDMLVKRYGITITDPEDMLDQIGRKRGFLLKGGIVDTERVHKMFLIELRGMKIGAMSYERPST